MGWRIPNRIPVVAALPVFALAALLGVGAYTFWYGQGYSYLSDDPAACVNCHVMRDNFDSWSVSSHRSVTCNSCHVPHGLVEKYLAKAEHGFRHSFAFTFGNVQVIRITPKSLHDVQENCIGCHEESVSVILSGEQGAAVPCSRCHRGAGHVF